ncbi:hypothetical protein CXB51_034989 [Gossypium anomalum]|uniref:Uncharacterized protein n=1 Tax=Gossypium anomalum TaxID=47600 RepID=A0A8J6CHV9_9ROSI|nr:hypothetical protein CXB51_034989 [Gossypium anomalum]
MVFFQLLCQFESERAHALQCWIYAIGFFLQLFYQKISRKLDFVLDYFTQNLLFAQQPGISYNPKYLIDSKKYLQKNCRHPLTEMILNQNYYCISLVYQKRKSRSMPRN